MFENIRADAKRYFAIDGWEQPSFVGRLFVLFFSYGFHATVVYRFGRSIEFFHRRVYLLPAYWFCLLFYHLLAWLCVKLYGINISRDAEIGKGFYIGHFGGIKVAQCHIGETCNIHQLTQIGRGCKIGSHVWAGAHSVIADGVAIDDCATVTETLQNVRNSTKSLYGGGVGLRIMSPKVYSFMIRVDYAWAGGPYRSQQLSFGTTQYFNPF